MSDNNAELIASARESIEAEREELGPDAHVAWLLENLVIALEAAQSAPAQPTEECRAFDWAEYRKDYQPNPIHFARESIAFRAGWNARNAYAVAPSPVQGADDRLAQAEQSYRVAHGLYKSAEQDLAQAEAVITKLAASIESSAVANDDGEWCDATALETILAVYQQTPQPTDTEGDNA